MDEMTAFDQQIAHEVVREAGPSEPVDGAAIFTTITATQSPKWRFQSMFSATKFVVAGAIVALFGGFLLAGVLTQQPSDEALPVAGASASAQAEPTAVITSEPEPTAEAAADASTTTANLLPGVDLVAEEVSPGIFRVLGDGTNDLSENIWHVAAAADGDVWVERHGFSEGGGSVDSRVFRLGHPEEYVLSRWPDLESEDQEVSLSATGDGLVVVRDLTSDGEEWVLAEGCLGEHGGFTGPDGSCWTVPPTSEVLRRLPGASPDDDDGHIVYELDELDMTAPAVGLSGWEGWPLIQLAMSGDGTIWATGDMPGTAEAQFSAFDGETWKRIPTMAPVRGLSPSLENVHLAIAGGPGATLWASAWDRAESVLHAWHWDGAGWTAYGPIETFPATARPLDESILMSGLHVSDDGVVWLDGLVRFQGESFQVFEVPASATSAEPRINSITHGPGGSLWMTVVDDAPPEPAVCTSEPDRWCPPVADGLYVITPEAVTATE